MTVILWRLWLALAAFLLPVLVGVLAPAESSTFDQAAYAAKMVARYEALDRALVAKGFPATSPWWMEQVRRFYESGRRQFVLRVGRRGGKSSTLARLSVLEALYGQHIVPPGDVGVVGFVSISRDEASQRLRTIKAILDALGVAHRPIDGGVELAHKPVVFKVFAATLGGVVGGTWIAGVADEVARWRDVETGANPATEVLASLRPALADQPHAPLFLSSSPMGKFDAHATAFDQGDTDFQVTACAPTWIARPALTEAMCRELEPDDSTFQREYGAIPFDGSASSIFTDAMLLKVTRRDVAKVLGKSGVAYVAATDPATRANAWTLVIGRAVELEGGLVGVQVVHVREWRAPRGGALNSAAIFADMKRELGEYGNPPVWQDQWSFDANRAIAEAHGIELLQAAATQASKVQMFENLRRRAVDETIELTDVPQLRADLCGVRKWIGKGGEFRIELERVGSRHCDFAPALALLVDKIATDGGTPAWVRAMQRYAQQLEPDDEAEPTIVLTYATHVDGRSKVTGHITERGRTRQVGEAYWTPGKMMDTWSWLFGSTAAFKDAAWADVQSRGLFGGNEEA